MSIHKITADYIYPISSNPIKNGVIVYNDAGEILEILNSTDGIENLTHYDGILCPGFINTHCHLELSHLFNKVNEGKGLTAFIQELQTQREADAETIQQAIFSAEQDMINNGIVAVGDISNGTDTFDVKTKNKLTYHTFIELYGFIDEQAAEAFNNGNKIKKLADSLNLNSSMVPHSPYATSSKLLKLIAEIADKEPISIHNQETLGENQLFEKGEGSIIDLMKWFGLDTAFWKPTNKSSLRSIQPLLPENKNILLVHNTLTTSKEVLEQQALYPNSYWCFCPNANWYIERKQPAYENFIAANAIITLGTDSLSSNWKLCILSEMQRIQANCDTIGTAELLKWATLNGANFLGVDDQLGSFDKGKMPGINFISNCNTGEITPESKVTKII